MTATTTDSAARPFSTPIFLLGLAGGVLLLALEKILELLVIVNFLTTVELALVLFAFAFGFANPMDLRDGTRLNRFRMLVTFVLLGFACQFNRDFTSMSFASTFYYPVPLPRASFLHQLALAGLFLLGAGIHYSIGSTLSREYRDAEGDARKVIAKFLMGFGIGACLVILFSYWSPYLWFAGGLVLAALVLLRPTFAAVAIPVAIATAVFFHLYPQRTFFLWASQTYQHVSSRFGRDVKIDFVSLWNDKCIGAVPNNMMATAECADTSWIPSEYDYLLRTIVNPFETAPPKYDAADKETNLPVPAWRKGLRVLDIGRSGGGNSRALELYSGPNTNTAIEFDAAIAEEWSQYWDKYGGGIYTRPDARVLTGDYRGNMYALADRGEKFDYVFYSGIGTKIYVHPRSYVFQEHWLLTEEGAALTFNELLKSDGIFWLDWGSSATEEGKWFVASFPPDVHILQFWAVQSEFPFAGSPHTYIVASKDANKIAAIKKRMARLTGFLDVDYRQNLDFYRTTDNRPFLQNDMELMIGIVHGLLSIVWLIPFYIFRKKVETRYGLVWKSAMWTWMLGIAWGFAEANISSFDAFVLLPVDLSNWSASHGLFLLAAAGGYIGALLTGCNLKFIRMTAPIVLAVGLWIPFGFRVSPLAFAGPILQGAPLGAMLAALSLGLDAKTRVGMLAVFLFGQASALIFYQFPAFWVGYTGMAFGTFVLAVVSVFMHDRVTKVVPA